MIPVRLAGLTSLSWMVRANTRAALAMGDLTAVILSQLMPARHAIHYMQYISNVLIFNETLNIMMCIQWVPINYDMPIRD